MSTEGSRHGRWWTAGGLPLAAGLVVAAVAATLLALRAGDDPQRRGHEVFVRASGAATDQGSYRFAMKQGLRGLRGRQTSFGTFGMRGSVNLRESISRFVTTTKGTGFDVNCTQIVSKDTLYTSVHPSRREQLGAEWVRSDTKALLAGAAFQFRPDELYEDPTRGFKNLKRSGTTKIRGISVNKYRGEIDFTSFFATQRASPQPTVLDIDLPVELLIDDEGLVHRMTFEVRSDARADFTFTITMDFFDYGKPVSIKPPSGSAVKAGTPQENATACFPVARPGPAQR